MEQFRSFKKAIIVMFFSPTIIVLTIISMIIFVKNEFFNEDFIKHEINKFKNGDEFGIKCITDFFDDFFRLKIVPMICNSILWILILKFIII